MPLSILVPLILVALPLVLGLVWFITRENMPELLTRERASEILAKLLPDLTFDEIIISDEQSVGLCLKEGKAVAMVMAFGKNYIAREIVPENIVSVRQTGDSMHLRMRQSDLGMIRFTISSEQTTQIVLAALEH